MGLKKETIQTVVVLAGTVVLGLLAVFLISWRSDKLADKRAAHEGDVQITDGTLPVTSSSGSSAGGLQSNTTAGSGGLSVGGAPAGGAQGSSLQTTGDLPVPGATSLQGGNL